MVHAARSSLAVTLFGLGLIASALAGACSGGEFSEAGPGAGGGQNDAGSTAGNGVGAGVSTMPPPSGTVSCKEPGECDDINPCTIDDCGPEGSCVFTPKCGDGERCCDGACGQCCVQEDCNDGLSCTADQCFNLFCAFVPDDGLCPMEQYCHGVEDCKQREMCPNGTVEECDDLNPCTEDSCDAGLCAHEFCSGGEQCCPGVGCGTCCSDSQCADDERCNIEVCQDGACQDGGELCADGEQCCAGADNATCGSCCEQAECDDEVACTQDACSGGQCTNEAVDALCDNNEICDLVDGCVPVGMCQTADDCVSADPCQTGDCVGGQCSFTGCLGSMQCCPGVGCRACCDNTQCAGQLCCDGVCQECCTRYDCGVVSLPTTAAATIPIGCENNQCVGGVCQTTYDMCDFGFCCAPYGCSINECGI